MKLIFSLFYKNSKKMRNILLIYIALISISCQQSKLHMDKTVFNSMEDFERRNLSISEVITFDSVQIMPLAVNYDENSDVLFASLRNDSKISALFNMKIKSYLGKIINKGKASNEFIDNIRDIMIDGTTNKISFFDNVTKKCLIYSIDELLLNIDNGGQNVTYEIFKTSEHIDNLIKFNNLYIGTTNSPIIENRLIKLNENGEMMEGVSNYPKDNDVIIESELNYFAYIGDMAISHKDSIMIVTNRLTDKIEIYNLHGILKVMAIGPENFSPKVEMKTNGNFSGAGFLEGCREAFYCPQIKAGKIWAIYKGGFMDNDIDTSTILTLNIDGTANCIYKLDRKITSFDVDENRKLIYAVDYTDDSDSFNIYAYKY